MTSLAADLRILHRMPVVKSEAQKPKEDALHPLASYQRSQQGGVPKASRRWAISARTLAETLLSSG
jgi:hypothetical protein